MASARIEVAFMFEQGRGNPTRERKRSTLKYTQRLNSVPPIPATDTRYYNTGALRYYNTQRTHTQAPWPKMDALLPPAPHWLRGGRVRYCSSALWAVFVGFIRCHTFIFV